LTAKPTIGTINFRCLRSILAVNKERGTGGSTMLSHKPLLRSEKVLLTVAGPMAVVLAIANPLMAIF
jgi:hypothetical protein